MNKITKEDWMNIKSKIKLMNGQQLNTMEGWIIMERRLRAAKKPIKKGTCPELEESDFAQGWN